VGYACAISLFIASLIQAYCFHHQWWIGFKYGLNVNSCLFKNVNNVFFAKLRNAVAMQVYRKLLEISPSAKSNFASGHLINLVTMDANVIFQEFSIFNSSICRAYMRSSGILMTFGHHHCNL
jgi:hypothetical protein